MCTPYLVGRPGAHGRRLARPARQTRCVPIRNPPVLQAGDAEVRTKLRALTDACFENVPSGVGEGGNTKLSRQDLAKLGTEGIAWAVDKGYAWPGDPEHIEARGHLEDADFSKVSERATVRGKDQLGSLGAGNHFVEIQKVDRVLDERGAKAMGIGGV